MENRALIVLFNGDEIPDNIISRISKEISTWCQADIEKITPYTLNEAELVKLIAKNTIKFENDAENKCKRCDDAIKILSESIDINTSIPLFAINLSTKLMAVLDRKKTIGLTESDIKFFDAFKTLGNGGPRTTAISERYHYTKAMDIALREIYNRIFDENGKIKK